MSLRLFPSETRSLELLTSLADVLRESLAADSELLATDSDGERGLLARLESLELKASDLHYALLTHLRTSFVNPLPREDLYAFSRLLHSAVSSVAGAGPLLQLAGAARSDRVPELLEILGRQADLSRTALAGLGKLESLEDTWLDLLRLASRARRTQQAWLLELADVQKFSNVVRQEVLALDLDRAAEALLGFADHLGHVLVKES